MCALQQTCKFTKMAQNGNVQEQLRNELELEIPRAAPRAGNQFCKYISNERIKTIRN